MLFILKKLNNNELICGISFSKNVIAFLQLL